MIHHLAPLPRRPFFDDKEKEEKKRCYSLNSFRVRKVSRGKKQREVMGESGTGRGKGEEEGIGGIEGGNRSSSLRFLRQRRYETKKSEPNADYSSQQQNIVQKRALKTEQAQLQNQLSKAKKRQKQIAKIFDPKTILKMGRKNSNATVESAHKQKDKQKEQNKSDYKNSYRFRKYVLENRGEGDRECAVEENYWKKVNQSLILGENCLGPMAEESKDLRQLYNCI